MCLHIYMHVCMFVDACVRASVCVCVKCVHSSLTHPHLPHACFSSFFPPLRPLSVSLGWVPALPFSRDLQCEVGGGVGWEEGVGWWVHTSTGRR